MSRNLTQTRLYLALCWLSPAHLLDPLGQRTGAAREYGAVGTGRVLVFSSDLCCGSVHELAQLERSRANLLSSRSNSEQSPTISRSQVVHRVTFVVERSHEFVPFVC